MRVNWLIQLAKPMVIDADALNILAAGVHWPTDFKAQADPHAPSSR